VPSQTTRDCYAVVKRAMDVVLSALALLVLSPLFVLLGAVIRAESPGPVLFRQKRLGKDGRLFTFYKLRTMKQGAPIVRNMDGSCSVLPGDPRLTRVGRWLREFSIDELPQLWNVWKGDMSLVGPRPDEAEAFSFYDDALRGKLRVKPGIANLPAVRGRNRLSWSQRAALDNFYIDHRSFRLDLSILLQTLVVVVTRQGIYTSAQSVATEPNYESPGCRSSSR